MAPKIALTVEKAVVAAPLWEAEVVAAAAAEAVVEAVPVAEAMEISAEPVKTWGR